MNLSEETISNELFGSINYNFVELNDSSSEEIEINLEVEPLHCCNLPNNNLLVSSDSSNCLKMLNSDLKTIKTINKINNESFIKFYTLIYFTYSFAIFEIVSSVALESDKFLHISEFLIIFKRPALLETFTILKRNYIIWIIFLQ